MVETMMDPNELDYHMQNLAMLDPDQLVNDLQLTSEEILDAFHHIAEAFIEREFG
jgi:hypothetical protein